MLQDIHFGFVNSNPLVEAKSANALYFTICRLDFLISVNLIFYKLD